MPTSVPQSNLNHEIRRLIMADGVRLFVRDYLPPDSAPQRTLLWCHGISEHGGRYEHVVAEFVARGWQVILPDLRGHGVSDGVRGDASSFDVYLEDFDRIVDEFQLAPSATALFGHSMGGLVMTRFAETRTRSWAALAMSAPLLGIAVKIPAWKLWAGRMLALVAPRTHFKTGIQETNLTRDPAFLAARRNDSLIHRSVTARWYYAMRRALDEVRRDAEKLELPVLILQGQADETTDPQAAAEWLRMTRSADRQLIEYPHGLHELLTDSDWRTITATLLDWLEARVPPIAAKVP